MLDMRRQHLTEDGSGVNYSTLAGSREFADYCKVASGLVDVDLSTYSQQERKAFFISIHTHTPLLPWQLIVKRVAL